MVTKGRAFCNGALTVLNAIGTGYGAAFGIGLKTIAEVEIGDVDEDISVEYDGPGHPELAVYTVKNVLQRFGIHRQVRVVTKSDIPISKGLKSSSSAANAIAIATLNAIGKSLSDYEIINLGIDAAVSAGVTVTGAYDDAVACYFGNGYITDNSNRKIIGNFATEERKAIILVPDESMEKKDFPVKRATKYSSILYTAMNELYNGNIRNAIFINSLVYSFVAGYDITPVLKLYESGIPGGITGTGPAVFALVKDDNIDVALDIFDSYSGNLIMTHVTEEKAGVL